MRLRFVSAGAAHSVVTALAAARSIEVEGSFGAVGAMRDQLLAGEACDIVILTRAQVAELAAADHVLGETAADIGTVATSIAVREGATAPAVADATALAAALRACDAIYFPDPAKATAGIHFAGVLGKLGIAAEVAARLRTFPNGATAMRELARSTGSAIGCTQATEILATPGVKLVAPLPAGLDLETVYAAAVASAARQRDAAKHCVGLLAGESSREQRAAAGFRL